MPFWKASRLLRANSIGKATISSLMERFDGGNRDVAALKFELGRKIAAMRHQIRAIDVARCGIYDAVARLSFVG